MEKQLQQQRHCTQLTCALAATRKASHFVPPSNSSSPTLPAALCGMVAGLLLPSSSTLSAQRSSMSQVVSCMQLSKQNESSVPGMWPTSTFSGSTLKAAGASALMMSGATSACIWLGFWGALWCSVSAHTARWSCVATQQLQACCTHALGQCACASAYVQAGNCSSGPALVLAGLKACREQTQASSQKPEHTNVMLPRQHPGPQTHRAWLQIPVSG